MEYYYDLVAHYGCEFTDLLKNFLRSRYEKGQRFEDEVTCFRYFACISTKRSCKSEKVKIRICMRTLLPLGT